MYNVSCHYCLNFIMKAFIVLAALCSLAYGRLRLPAPRLDGRIVGGVDTEIGELPYQLSLQSYGSHICGASIISETWAVTAAHCVENARPSAISLRAGSSSRGQGGTVHQAARIISHPQYNRFNIDFDYAVIEVSTPFSFNANVQPIALASAEPAGGDAAIVSGWGRLSSGGSTPNQLQSVRLPIVARNDCQERYRNYDITQRMICAGVLDVGGVDSCQGDSGGPLASNGVQVGIVSWGLGCASPDYPGVYSNVAVGREWIRQQTGV